MQGNIKGDDMAGRKGTTNKPVDQEARNINVTIRFSQTEIQEIEKIANDLDVPKTRLIRNLALIGLDNVRILSNTGVLKGAKKFIDFKERLLNPKNYQTLPEFEN